MSRSIPGLPRHLSESQLVLCIDRFYEAATNSELWRPALQQFSEATGAEGCLLLRHGAGSGSIHICSEGLDKAIPRFFNEEWHVRSQAIPRGALAAQRGVVIQTEWELFSRDAYRRDPFHMEFLRPHGFAWFAGFFMAQNSSDVITVSPQRRSRDEPFSKCEIESLTKALPHFRRAGAVAIAFSRARMHGALDSLHMLEIPAFLLDHLGCVHHMNADAAALIGNGLELIQHRLCVKHRSVNVALQRLIHSLVRSQPAHEVEFINPVRVPRAFGQPLLVSGVPLVGAVRDMFKNGNAILTVVDPDAGRSRSELLIQRAFGLTRAEAATATAVASGLDLAETAAHRGVGIETVRSQVKSVGVKTGANTRGAQVALFNRILAAMLENRSG